MKLEITCRDLREERPVWESLVCKYSQMCDHAITGLCDVLDCESFEAKEVETRNKWSLKTNSKEEDDE